jgi:hypothetical protein
MDIRKIKGPKRLAAGVILILSAIIFKDNIEVAQCALATGIMIIVSGLLAKGGG